MKNQLAIIYWTDACLHGNDQLSRKVIKEKGLIDGVAIGHLVYEDKEKISLGLDYFPIEDQFRCVGTYPKSGIHKIIRLPVKK